jgi:hypothetical protein
VDDVVPAFGDFPDEARAEGITRPAAPGGA